MLLNPTPIKSPFSNQQNCHQSSDKFDAIPGSKLINKARTNMTSPALPHMTT